MISAIRMLLRDRRRRLQVVLACIAVLVSGGRASTPPLAEGPLPGVTRAAVLEEAGALTAPVDERPLSWEALTGAEEAFLTNALMGLVPLTSAEGNPIGTGRPGPFTRRIREGFLELVRRERV